MDERNIPSIRKKFLIDWPILLRLHPGLSKTIEFQHEAWGEHEEDYFLNKSQLFGFSARFVVKKKGRTS